ncbi:MAG: hypothetical protein IJZ20_00860 [Clostridia bacterium]|nr:hypothetical protein [Clostridia bacterium]
MSNISGLKFYINDDLNVVVDDCRGKTVKHKVISLATFCKLIEKNSKPKAVQSGLLPDRCICFRENADGERFVAIDIGNFNVDITYEKTIYKDFPIPRLLFGFRVSKDFKINEVQVAVADKGPLRDETKLYKYPFSNVSGFNMCIGSNAMPKIKQLRQLNGIPYYIFAMPDNNDRYSPGRTKLDMQYRELLEFMKDKESDYYYGNVLISSGKTLKDFIYQ